MPRPSRNLTRISVYLPADALDGLDVKAARLTAQGLQATRSDVIRLAVEDYLQARPGGVLPTPAEPQG
jgi:metal-responsive CopG/Arc/MetJ family transcriptional regulator